jgi:alkylhydroperoxidase family enzyme
MSDLIERLRRCVSLPEKKSIAHEAADELERLRRHLRDEQDAHTATQAELAELPIALELVKTWRQQAERLERELAEAKGLLKSVVNECACARVDIDAIDAFLAGEKNDTR